MTKKIHPKTRLKAIKTIIESEEISNQKQILDLLRCRFNITTTQSIISRDLKKLSATIKRNGNKRTYALFEADTYSQMLHLSIRDIQYNEVMLVITTSVGVADFVGDFIDAQNFNILGCISGENTILVIPRTIDAIESLYQQICKKLYFYKKSDGRK